MEAVFLSRSQWMLPTVLGFNPSARNTTTETSQPCRSSRFCHTQSLADAKLSASTERSCARVSPGVGQTIPLLLGRGNTTPGEHLRRGGKGKRGNMSRLTREAFEPKDRLWTSTPPKPFGAGHIGKRWATRQELFPTRPYLDRERCRSEERRVGKE